MDLRLPRHLVLSLFLFEIIKETLRTQTTALSASLATQTEASFLSIPFNYASLPTNLPRRIRLHLHALFRKLHKSLSRCDKRLSCISGFNYFRCWTTVQVSLRSHHLRKFQKSLKQFDACVTSIEEVFSRVYRIRESFTTGSLAALSTNVNHRNTASNRPRLPLGAVQTNVLQRAANAVGKVRRKVKVEMGSIVAMGTVCVYAMWSLILAVVVVGRKGDWIR